MLKKQDILLLAKLLSSDVSEMTYAGLGKALCMSSSEIHAATERLISLRLLSSDRTPIKKSALEFLIHGFKYVFPLEYRVRLIRGIPTASAAPVAEGFFMKNTGPVPVWPSPTGNIRGQGVEPLYPSVVKVVEENPELYAILALLDMLRMGKARETSWAENKLKEIIQP